MTAYRQGLVTVEEGVHAYLQPDGSWGLNNAGLIASDGESLLVDTLYDLLRTRRMLDELRPVIAGQIDTVINTHANGDHCWGNQVVQAKSIIASRRGAAEMHELPPKRVAMLVKVARLTTRFGAPARALLRALGALGLQELGAVARAAPFVLHAFGQYDFDDIRLTPPTRTFDGELELHVGARKVHLIEVGPAHTQGDLIVHVPDARTVFTGDILFVEAHPIVWAGPFSNWIRACERIEALAPEHVIPGHGRLATLADVRNLAAYLRYVLEQSRLRYEAGIKPDEAARDIALEGFRHWRDAERIVVNVRMAYRELAGTDALVPTPVQLFASMADYWLQHGAQTPR